MSTAPATKRERPAHWLQPWVDPEGERTRRQRYQAKQEARAALEEATAHYHKLSDAIVRALGVES